MKRMISKMPPLHWLVMLWLLLGLTCIIFVPIRPEDELHYLGIAWNMFKAHSWLLTYSMADAQKIDLEKTPLLYWFILAGWHVFGVSDTLAKIIVFMIGSANMGLTYLLARQLFPENPRIAWLSLAVLLGNFLWPRYFGSAIRFEGLITVFGLLFLIFLLKYLRDASLTALITAGLAFGFCLFAKGGVGFIYYLPLAILLPYLQGIQLNLRWVLTLIAVIGIALILPIIYLLYVAQFLGNSELHYLLFTQISQRVGVHFQSKAWLSLMACFLPVLVLFRFKKLQADRRVLLLMTSIGCTFLFFSLAVSIQAKRYFIPVCPLIALVIAYWIDQVSHGDRTVVVFSVLFSVAMMINNIMGYCGEIAKYDENLTRLGAEVRSLQLKGYTVAQFTGQIRQQNLDFFGRLPRDLPIMLSLPEQLQWLQANPQGYRIEDCEPAVKKNAHCYQLKQNLLTLSVWNEKPVRYWPAMLDRMFSLKLIPY